MAAMDRDRFTEIVLGNPINAALLRRLSALALPDCYLVSG